MPRPFLLVGAAPGMPTGTSRIATTIAQVLWDQRAALDIDLLHVGWSPLALPVEGVALQSGYPWPVWAYQEGTGNFGMRAAQVGATVRWGAAKDGVVFAIEDPARAFTLLPPAQEIQGGSTWERWGYFSVDGTNRNGTLGGPAALAVQQYRRVLAHTSYGALVLDRLRRETDPTRDAVAWIPHGIDRALFHSEQTETERLRAMQLLNPTGTQQRVIGCVVTNETRKDVSLFIETLALLRLRGLDIRGWLHIDREVGEAWSVPQLAADAGIDWQALSVTHNLTDRELALCYAGCTLTIAPGRGESFGYPILESLACGTPCLHVNYAGGATLIPERWRMDAALYHQVGPYGIERPIVAPITAAAFAVDVLDEVQTDWRKVRAECVQRAARYDQRTVDVEIMAWVSTQLERS